MVNLEYKGFLGSLNFHSDACYYFGNLQLKRDKVMYQAASIAELENSFKNSVDNYLADCAAFGIEPG
ncbi:hypothetical protein [Planctobacterium marinum]|uniref:hypothetical protein n=1 Tax=Planctobacterium marinum TaxID=1631968 RepID=UPI001E5906FE|nr:hypothetical protein [Planctobacterium marinum]MCC2605544.1 hypothetical protein [Planctobacterium marinum]